MLHQLLIILLICVTFCRCSFNFDAVRVIENPLTNLHSYFGYSLVLQNNAVIVGAPKKISATEAGGGIFRCDLNYLNCSKYFISPSAYDDVDTRSNGNFLGAVLDVDSHNIYTCAPRALFRSQEFYFTNGVCYTIDFYGRVEMYTPFKHKDQTRRNLYIAAYAEVGFDLKFIKERNSLILGVPGDLNWSGGVVEQSIFNKSSVDHEYTELKSALNTDYLGYKVTAGYMNNNPVDFWIVAGKPRGNKLLGSVKIFAPESGGNQVISNLIGDEIGAYFGFSVLIGDYNSDGYKDLLVGVPMGAGQSYDEGYVYYYSHQNTIFNKISKLEGSKISGSRFGSVLSNIGDLDYDGYNDVAIAAPYENNGAGAVYIYKGSPLGLRNEFSQKIEPSQFRLHLSRRVRGFGFGISKGVDINSDGYNDLAIGAYQSDQVFIIKSKPIIDYKLRLSSESKDLQIDTHTFNVKYCIQFNFRKIINTTANWVDTLKVGFKIRINLDKRGYLPDALITNSINIISLREKCFTIPVALSAGLTNFIRPFQIGISCNLTDLDFEGFGENADLAIPFSHGCGDDRICQTNLSLTTSSSTSKIIHSVTNELDVNVAVENFGEPAYDCELIINATDSIILRNILNCNKKNGTYICPVANVLRATAKNVELKFDINKIPPHLRQIQIDFVMKSSGNNSVKASSIFIPVELSNLPYIEGKSTPENLEYDSNKQTDGILHTFLLGNEGPSPAHQDIIILIPNEVQVFTFVDAKSSYQNMEQYCIPLNDSTNVRQSLLEISLNVPKNRSVSVDCLANNANCLQYYCKGNYLDKFEHADYNIQLTINYDALINKYGNDLIGKEIISFTTTAVSYNSTSLIYGHATSLIYVKIKQPVAIWIYVVAAISGLILLVLLVFILYKCHFFDRDYRDKLMEEKLVNVNEMKTADDSSINDE